MALCVALHPHLVRSYRMGRRVAARQRVGESLAQVLDRAPWGIFLTDARGRVSHFNRAGGALLAEAGGLAVMGGQLSAGRAADGRRRHQHL